jgi:hypothetical protein
MLIRIVQITEIHVSDDTDPPAPSDAIDTDGDEIPPSAPRLRVAPATRSNIVPFGPRFQLSLINSPTAHFYSFAWEAAVRVDGKLCYTTPLTEDVEVFETDDEANAFIARAREYFASPEAAALPVNTGRGAS